MTVKISIKKQKRKNKYLHLRRNDKYFIKKTEIAAKLIYQKLINRGYDIWPIEKSPYSESRYIYLKKLDHPTKKYIKIRISCHSLDNDNSDIQIYV